MRFLIALEQTDEGFAVQAPDLAVVTHGRTVEEAKRAAVEAIEANLETYIELNQPIPAPQPAENHLQNPDFAQTLFTYVEVKAPQNYAAA